MELFPHRLGDNDPACLVNDETGIHFGTIAWVDPFIKPISPGEKLETQRNAARRFIP
jgi:hypothetical protein